MCQATQVAAALRTRMTARTTAARMGPSVWTKPMATPASVLRATGEQPLEAPRVTDCSYLSAQGLAGAPRQE